MKVLKLLLGIVIVSSCLLSCVTQRRCLQKFPLSVDTTIVHKVVIKDSIVFKDTIVEYLLPGEIYVDSIFIDCPEPPKPYIADTVRVSTQFAMASAWFDGRNIQLKLVQPDTTLQIRLDNALKESYHWKSEYEKEKLTKTQQIKYIPTIYRIAFWIVLGQILSVIGYGVLKFLK